MAISSFIPAIWSAAVLRAFAKASVFRSLVTDEYLGELKGAGDRVKVPTVDPVSIKAYTRGADISYDSLNGSTTEIVVTRERYFAIKADDVDQFQSKPAFLEAAVTGAGEALADEVDSYVATKMAAGASLVDGLGTDVAPLAINSGDVLGLLALMAQRLDEARVPREGRWIVLPPWAMKKLVLSGLTLATDNDSILATGEVGRAMGFRILVSLNVPNTGGAKYKILAGIDRATAHVEQIGKIEAIRLPNTFADGVRGLYVYESAVIRPTALACATVNEAAEA